MAENITISICKDGTYEPPITSSGYLLIYLKGEDFKFSGTLELKALTPILLKLAVEKMTK